MAGLGGLSVTSDQTIGTVQIDAKLRERHESDIKLTEFPLEDGAIATDHRIIKPKVLKIEGIVSNAKNALEELTGHIGNSDVTAYEQLVQLQESGIPFSLVSDLVVYDNMQIKDITANKDVSSANSLIFSASLQSMLIVNTQTVKLPKDKIPVPNKDRGSSTDDQGTKTPQDAGKPTDPANKSYAARIFDAL